MGPFLPNCRFKGFFILVHASLKMHLFFKALYLSFKRVKSILFSFVLIGSVKSHFDYYFRMEKVQNNMGGSSINDF